MEVDKIIIPCSAMDKLRFLQATISDITEELQNHESLSAYSETDYRNMMIEVKGIKQNFVDFTSYTIFLEQFLKPVDKWMQESEVVAKSNELTGLYIAEDKMLKKVQDEEDKVISELTEIADHVQQIDSWEDAASQIKEKKQQCKKLASSFKAQLDCFGEECKNVDDAQEMIVKQRETIQNLRRKIFLIVHTLENVWEDLHQKVLHTLQLADSAITTPQSIQSMSDSDGTNKKISESLETIEDLGGIKVISEIENITVLEVFFVNSIGKKSSIEAKLKYDNEDRGKLISVSLQNLPINVDEVIERAVEMNDFACVIPDLQYRLSQTM